MDTLGPSLLDLFHWGMFDDGNWGEEASKSAFLFKLSSFLDGDWGMTTSTGGEIGCSISINPSPDATELGFLSKNDENMVNMINIYKMITIK